MLTPKASARFFASFVPEPNSGCWLWTGRLNKKGYAYFAAGRGWVSAHRLSYRLAKGEIPEPLEIDHKCRVRCCVNPDHLEAVVHVENCRRGKPVHQTHCKRGHPLHGENVARNGAAGRKCRTCQLLKQREHYHKTRQMPGRWASGGKYGTRRWVVHAGA